MLSSRLLLKEQWGFGRRDLASPSTFKRWLNLQVLLMMLPSNHFLSATICST
jgi:hypothetical protein